MLAEGGVEVLGEGVVVEKGVFGALEEALLGAERGVLVRRGVWAAERGVVMESGVGVLGEELLACFGVLGEGGVLAGVCPSKGLWRGEGELGSEEGLGQGQRWVRRVLWGEEMLREALRGGGEGCECLGPEEEDVYGGAGAGWCMRRDRGLLQRGWGDGGVWAGAGTLMWKSPLRGGRLE